MIQVPGETLWLGNVGDVQDVRKVLSAGVKAVVDLAANEPIPKLTRDLIYFRFPLSDSGENPQHLLQLALATVAGLLHYKIQTLLYCNNGMSRSPAVAAGALSFTGGRSPDHRLDDLRRLKPLDVNPALWQEIVEVLDKENWQV